MKALSLRICLPVLLFATPALAAQGLVELKPFTGPSARKVQAAVREELCSSIVCGKNSKGNSKLSGRVVKQPDGWAVELKLWDRDGRPVMRKQVDLSKTFTPRGGQLASARSLIVHKLTASQDGGETPSGRERRLGRLPSPTSRAMASADEDDAEDTSSRKSAKLSKRKAADDEELEDDTPRRSRRSAAAVDSDDEESPSSRKLARASKSSRASDDETSEESDSPRRKSSRASAEESEETDSPRRKSARASAEESEETDSPRRKSARASLDDSDSSRRKSSRASSDETDSPRRRRGSDEVIGRRSLASADSEGEVGGVERDLSREERPSPRVDPLFTVEASTWFFSRSFRYDGQNNPGLISMPGGLSMAPRISVELFPFARRMGGGIGAQFSIARTLGNKIQLSDGRSFGATVQNWDASLAWKFLPWGTGRSWITPHAGLHGMQFAVGQDANGGVLNGLPGTNYLSVALGAGAGVPVGERVSLFADLAYQGVLTSGQLTSVNYFNGGRANGFSARAGVAVRVISMLEITASGGYDIYVATFAKPADGVVNALGSSDAYLSGSLGLKLLL